jgi:hypothetical protein
VPIAPPPASPPATRRARRSARRAAVVAAALLAACDARPDVARPETPVPAPAAAPSIDASLAEFRAGLPAVTALEGGAPTRDALVQRFVRAVERRDTLALRAMALSRAEFAYLYYPSTRYVRAPYELAPETLWFLSLQNSEKGIGRLVDRRGGAVARARGPRLRGRAEGGGREPAARAVHRPPPPRGRRLRGGAAPVRLDHRARRHVQVRVVRQRLLAGGAAHRAVGGPRCPPRPSGVTLRAPAPPPTTPPPPAPMRLAVLALALLVAGAGCASGRRAPTYLAMPGATPRPFSAAVRANGFLFLAGQLGTDSTGRLAPAGSGPRRGRR